MSRTPGSDQALEPVARERRALGELDDRAEGAVSSAFRRQLPCLVVADAFHVLEADPHRTVLDRALGLAAVQVRRPNLHVASLRIAHQARRRVEAHRLFVEERAQELGRIVVA